ncbi:MAG: chemotaxis protein CheA [Bacteroides sp.]|nr:chemotaxis protein CheA [Prevotella sp.]MCM1406996.1 chemotaxis protein CheA [Treponema brennaborense]MCM1470147.1 chemotaxis protein CheA [Bacteroides sp.]
MLDKMSGIFLDEASDLLDKLEDLLLELERQPEDAETISAIFRIMHTIKGSSAMFGFDAISHFTHEAENAFDAVRNGKVHVTPDLITLTLKTRDHIRNMLDADDSSAFAEKSEEIILEFKKYLAKNSTDPELTNSVMNDLPKETAAEEAAQENSEEKIYRISFTPSADIFKNGTRPHALFEELDSLGKMSTTAFLNKIPPLQEILTDTCYASWEILLTTTKNVDSVKDVFIFLDSKSVVDIKQIGDDAVENGGQAKKLGEILVEKNIISHEQIEQALSQQKQLGEILTEQKLVSKEDIQAALAEQSHIKEIQSKKQQEQSAQSIKVNSEKLDKLIDLVGELVTFNARLGQLSGMLNNPQLVTLGEQGERLILELRDTTMDMRMLPIGTIFSRFRRLIRDLSGDLKKNIELVTEGAETELDKTVIEKLNDPLVHLIRNSADHGIELPEARVAAGKPAQGVVILKAQHAGAFVLITIKDDGAGLNKDKILKKALEKGLIQPSQELTDQEIFDLIFLPGFSTSDKVTSVSGRGVGMDVVKKDITALGGTVSISSTAGKETTFTLKLPLTLAIIEGILVQIGKRSFVIPLSNVIECLEFERHENKMCSSINIRNEVIPYIDLRTFFDIKDPVPAKEQIIIVTDQDSKIGLIIDKTIGNHQTVIKPLGKLYKHATGLSGATILGDGSVALILDIYKLSDIVRELDTK